MINRPISIKNVTLFLQITITHNINIILYMHTNICPIKLNRCFKVKKSDPCIWIDRPF